MSPAKPTRTRADARRNRERIIEAADSAFRECGLDVSVAEIARRAEVGSGTLFRNFPTKEDLIAAIIEGHINAWQEEIDAALGDDDVAGAFSEMFARAVNFNIGDRGMLEAIKQGVLDESGLVECKMRAFAQTDLLIERARQAGVVRADFDANDFYALSAGIADAIGTAAASSNEPFEATTRRFTEMALAGLRP